MSVRSTALAVAFVSLFSLSRADIDYKVSIHPVDGAAQRMQVTLTIPVRSAVTTLQIPNWGPGSYVLSDFWKGVQDVKATADGGEIEPTKPNDYTWTIPTAGLKQVTFSYSVPVQISEEIAHFSGPRSYFYVVDRKNEKCNLTLDLPEGWNVATGLDGSIYNRTAPNYDVLADNPVTVGKYREMTYLINGRPHVIAMYGQARNDLDTDYLLKSSSFIAAAENDFFGNKTPYSHYVWHFNVGKRADGGGGLEHLASTEITLANGLGPGIIGVNAHEFFHLWNVKRIRSRVLGPFDYTKLPETGALWWLEGVTEYFAHQIMTRYGFWDDKKWYATLVKNIRSVRGNPARLEVGPYESSFRVKDANNGRGNSQGYKISYYDLGVLAGTCLDIELLSQTKGKRSLDDVEHALWDLCKHDKPGFEEGEIRNQCVRFGGPALGEFYDRIIMHGGEMPMEEELAKVGLKLVTFDKEFTDFGVVVNTSLRSGGMTVLRAQGPAAGQLKPDDVILEVNGTAVPTNGAWTAVTEKVKAGENVNFKVKRGEETALVTITTGKTTRSTQEIQEDPAATEAQLKLRDIWLYRGKKGWKAPAVITPGAKR